MFDTKFCENRSRPLNFRWIWIFVNRDIKFFKSDVSTKLPLWGSENQERSSKKELCEICEETIWESRFTCCWDQKNPLSFAIATVFLIENPRRFLCHMYRFGPGPKTILLKKFLTEPTSRDWAGGGRVLKILVNGFYMFWIYVNKTWYKFKNDLLYSL